MFFIAMKKLIYLLLLIFPCFASAQVTPPDEDNDWEEDFLTEEEFSIPDTDAYYKDGIKSLQNYIGNNFNFNNVTIKDIPDDLRNESNYLMYIAFDIDDTGKPENFTSENTSSESSFFKEATRVIASTRWEPAVRSATEVKQHFVIPLILRIDDLDH